MILVLNSKISSIGIVIDIEISGTGIDKCIEAIEYQKRNEIAHSVNRLGRTQGMAAVKYGFLGVQSR